MALSESIGQRASGPNDHLRGYEAARESAAYLLLPQAGLLRIEGNDRVAFMQRQTTNDLNRLAAGRVLPTVLTSPAARILDVLAIIEEEGALLTITLPERDSQTAQFLQSKIFFMDKVRVIHLADEFMQAVLVGPAAPEVLSELGCSPAPGLDEVVSLPFAGAGLRVFGERAPAGAGFRLIWPSASLEPLTDVLDRAGAEAISAPAFDVLRVEWGLPGPSGELNQEYTPLETGLQHAISENKGCYTGQEVIARQITYDKVTRQLVGLRCSALVEAGDRIWAGERPAGEVTSAVESPRFGAIALAVLKRPYHEPGTEVLVGQKEQGASAETVALPF